MKTYKYKNYAEYVKCQIAANKKKFNNCWAIEENIKAIAKWIDKNIKFKSFRGLCHGVRQGFEVEWFEKYANVNMYGTDIGKTNNNTYIIEHDFNKPMNNFIAKFDFIYSNSFDHAYDPEKTFNVWANQLQSGGVIILEYDRRQEHTGEISKGPNKVDPVSIRFEELIKLVPKWRKNAKIIEMLDMPIVTKEWRKAIIIEVE